MKESPNQKRDSAEEALLLLERENEEFKRHWVWRELNSTPEAFFNKVKQHVQSLNIPKEEWDNIYHKTKEAHRIRALEKRSFFKPANLKLLGAIRV